MDLLLQPLTSPILCLVKPENFCLHESRRFFTFPATSHIRICEVLRCYPFEKNIGNHFGGLHIFEYVKGRIRLQWKRTMENLKFSEA